MHILICPDSFKHSLSAVQVARIIGEELEKYGHTTEFMPIADGGEGTVETLLFNCGGEKKFVSVRNPLGKNIEAFYGLNGKRAYMEMAQASGLTLISETERNPWITTTFGVGEMIRDALDQGAEEIWIGIGGSATNDCGIGMAQALGIRFLDKDGKELTEDSKGLSASSLNQIAAIDDSGLDPRIKTTKIKVFCDVENPLYGEKGASFTYSSQKGASPEMTLKLEDAVKTFVHILEQHYHKDPNFPGAGAAGGLGAGLKIFLQADIISGIDALITCLHLEEKIQKADLVVIGEGQMDFQTVYGKAPTGIAKLTKSYEKPVIAIVGKVGKGYEQNFEMTKIDHIFSCYNQEAQVPLEVIKKDAETNLRRLVAEKVGPLLPSLAAHKYQLTSLL